MMEEELCSNGLTLEDYLDYEILMATPYGYECVVSDEAIWEGWCFSDEDRRKLREWHGGNV